MSATGKSLEEIRSEVCDSTLKVVAVLSVPALALSLSRVLQTGWNAVLTIHVCAVISITTVAILRRRVSYRSRANTLIGLFLWLAWAGQVFSPAPTAFVYLVSVCVMATVFYGERIGIACISASVLMTMSTYMGFKYGLYEPVPANSTMTITTWLSRSASVVIASVGPVIAVSRFWHSLVDERRRAEAANDAKSDFLGMMSHELRTPMAAIIGTAEMLESDPAQTGSLENVRRIKNSAKNLLSLLNDLLDFAKIEAQQMSIENAAFSLKEILGEARELFAPLAEAKKVALFVEYPPDCGDVVRGDAGRLRQIIQNLVGNAIKFTSQGSVRISIREEKITANWSWMRIAVTDTGTGIAPEDQERLFKPFVQGEGVTARRYGGTGLGLAISLKLAKLMGGDVTLRSAVGEGSTFTVAIPMEIAKETIAAQTPADTASAPVTPLHVLLAEDNEALRELMQTMISRRGHAVEAVVNGQDALRAVMGARYDVVLMDMHMPVMDGLEATRAIRSLDGAMAHIPILALTAGLTAGQKAAYLDAGVDDIVAKPAHWPSLFDAMERRGRGFRDAHSPAAEAATTVARVLEEGVLVELEKIVGKVRLAEMLTTFRTGVDNYSVGIRTGLAEQNLRAARLAAHGLKGGCVQFGALELGRMASEIEFSDASLEDLLAMEVKLAPAIARLDAALASRIAVAAPQ